MTETPGVRFASLVLALLAVLALSGCARHEERVYRSLSDVAHTDESSIIGIVDVPLDATDIRIRFDVETDHYYFSYSTRDVMYAVRHVEMAPVADEAHEEARDSVWRGVDLPAQVAIHRQCIVHPDIYGRGTPWRVEIRFVASADGRQHQWNEQTDPELITLLCAEEQRRVDAAQ
ncbi:hypothetical protein [Stenotrophomonas sp.]|uniref:hypothetical protein n=1 Tax=Stenotrophomonas sp. TaxID=69392 RepID=UPI002FCAC672